MTVTHNENLLQVLIIDWFGVFERLFHLSLHMITFISPIFYSSNFQCIAFYNVRS